MTWPVKNSKVMKLRFFLLLFLTFGYIKASSQLNFKGNFVNEELQIRLALNLYEDNIPVPGFELDSCYGYLQGRINGVWIILQVTTVDQDEAHVRAVSERGGDAQDLLMTFDGGKIFVRQIKGACIKGVSERKYKKLPKDMVFEK